MNNGDTMLLDKEDYEKLKNKTIYYVQGGYPSFNSNGERTYVHRFIMNVEDEKIIDHKNMNILDNRKENLRITSHIYNHGNVKKYNLENPTSQYKGVTYDKSNKNWLVRVKYNQSIFYTGRHSNEISAAHAYNHYAKKAFGEFAYLNDLSGYEDTDWRKDVLVRKPSNKQSGYKYVTWDSYSKKWKASVRKDRKQVRVKSSDCVIECLLATNEYILKYDLFLLDKSPRSFQVASEEHMMRMSDNQLERYNKHLKEYKRKSKMQTH